MLKIQIKSKLGEVLFEHEKENNTIKDTVEKAVKNGVNLEGADLEGTYLKGANLGGAYLNGANLEGAYLNGANLEGANLEGADLEGADLIGANLGGAYLNGAYLNGANLDGTNLEGADLEGANLKGAYLYITNYNLEEIIEGNDAINIFEKRTNINILKTYINKHIISPSSLIYWKNGLVIDEYEYVEDKKEKQEMNIQDIEETKIETQEDGIEYFVTEDMDRITFREAIETRKIINELIKAIKQLDNKIKEENK